MPPAPVCAYKDNVQVRCEGRYALFTAHDGRGCRRVCINHAVWLANNSIVGGHSSSCPENEANTVRQSVANAVANFIEGKILTPIPAPLRAFIKEQIQHIRDGRWAS